MGPWAQKRKCVESVLKSIPETVKTRLRQKLLEASTFNTKQSLDDFRKSEEVADFIDKVIERWQRIASDRDWNTCMPSDKPLQGMWKPVVDDGVKKAYEELLQKLSEVDSTSASVPSDNGTETSETGSQASSQSKQSTDEST